MILANARNILAEILQPCSYDEFFDKVVGQKTLAVSSNGISERSMMLGSDPKKIILRAFEKYAPLLTSHIQIPATPPPTARAVSNPEAFLELVREYHRVGYTVRIPDANNLSVSLSRFSRALEIIVENPVGVVIFWSDDGAAAPVHFDEVDVIAMQLLGTKTWYISDEPATLPNKWTGLGQGEPALGSCKTYDVRPGDFLYIPRGTTHTVKSTSESIHLSIGFASVTVRDAINAVLDFLSDLDRPLRTGLGTRADDLATSQCFETMKEQMRQGLEKLSSSSKSAPFIQHALSFRRSKMIFDLPKLAVTNRQEATSVNDRIRHSPLAVGNMVSTPEIIDFRQPGEQILIHPGAGQCLHFILNTENFKIADITGNVDDEIRLALVNRLLATGFLEKVP